MIEPNGKKVVYLLGAGASFNALPVVGELPSALRRQTSWIRWMVHSLQGNPAMNSYMHKLDELAVASEKYGSIDTYARSLYLLRKHDELAELKLHLAMYFLLEQAVEAKEYGPTDGILNDETKRDQIDKRYMTWLAQILDNDGVFSPRVRILSWNYDLQLEHAMGLYRGISHLSDVHNGSGFQVYPDPSAIEKGQNQHPSLIHLNGVTGHANWDGHKSVLYDGLVSGDPDAYIIELFDRYHEYDRREQHMLHSMTDTFNFAWEDKPIAKRGVELAVQCLHEADVLVVIGYSFPPFNRTIDARLIQSFRRTGMNTSRRIYIQSPNMTKESFGHLFSLNDKLIGLSADSSVDQFYLPPELFN